MIKIPLERVVESGLYLLFSQILSGSETNEKYIVSKTNEKLQDN